MQHQVFLSYSHKDVGLMQQVRDVLVSAGVTVWVDEGIKPGTPLWKDSIENAIENTGCLIVLLSPEAKKSIWVKRELEYAEIQEKPIFPLLGKGNIKNSVPFAVIGMQLIDLTSEFTFGMLKIVNHIKGLGLFVEAEKQTIQSKEINQHKVDFIMSQLQSLVEAQNGIITYDDILRLFPYADMDIGLLDDLMDRLVALEVNVVSDLESANEVERGFLDFAVDGDLAIHKILDYLIEITDMTLLLSMNISSRTIELKSSPNNVTTQASIIKNSSSNMSQFAKDIDKTLTGFRQSWESFGANVTQLLTFANTKDIKEINAILTFRSQLQELQNSLRASQAEISSLLLSISLLPEISKDIKRGKRQASNAVSKLIEELNSGDSILTNILLALDNLLEV